MNELIRRCHFTVDYHSKAFVEDAIHFARWILRLQGTNAADRERMLADLGIGEVNPDRQTELLANADMLEEMAKRLRKGTTDSAFLSAVALELDVRAHDLREQAAPPAVE